MREEISLGPTPSEERCVQLGEANYESRAYEECQRYVEVLKLTYRQAHNSDLPPNVRLKVKEESHDFGVYYDVVVVYSNRDDAAVEAAYWLESNSPANWPTGASNV